MPSSIGGSLPVSSSSRTNHSQPLRFRSSRSTASQSPVQSTNDDAEKARALTEFRPPNTKRWFQRVALNLNAIVFMRMMKGITPVISKEDAAKLRALPKNAGNILAGTHPGPNDAFLMFHLYHVAKRMPSGFYMASEGIESQSKLARKVLSWVGAIPVARGKKNTEAVSYLTQKIAQGGWGGIYPEGEIYFSRQVMPMEWGALRTAVEAAIQVQQEASKQGIPKKDWRPIYVTPFAHVYMHEPESLKAALEKSLSEVEAHPDVFGQAKSGDLIARIKQVGERLMDAKAERYGIPKADYAHEDIFERNRKLKTRIIEDLEKKYMGQVHEGYERRRAHKVKIEIYERMKNPDLTPEERQALKTDLDKTRDIVFMAPFDRAYLNEFNDMEMWGEFLKRFRTMLKMPETDYGRMKVVYKIMDPIDIHPIAAYYDTLPKEEQDAYLSERTEELRQIIQEAVKAICRENPIPSLFPQKKTHHNNDKGFEPSC